VLSVGAFAIWGATSVASAQTARGLVVDEAGRPIAGIVTLLLDSASNSVGRTLSNDAGEFSLRGASSGTFRVRALRIGYRPVMSGPIRLQTGRDTSLRLILSALPIALDTVRVADQRVCRHIDADSSAVVFTAWEQIRAALTSAELTAAGQRIVATTIVFSKAFEPTTNHLLSNATDIRREYASQPWRGTPLDSLRRIGYVTHDKDDVTTFRSPGLETLISAEFAVDHCFRLGRSSDPRELLVEFEPTPERRRIPEINGSIWVDRSTAELRRIQFRYSNVSPEESSFARGDMSFARVSNDGWVVATWSIQMPVLELSATTRSIGGHVFDTPSRRVTKIETVGGMLTMVEGKDHDTLWRHPPISVRGAVVDSVSGAPVGGSQIHLSGTGREAITAADGRFSIKDVSPAEYRVDIHTPSLDSLGLTYAKNTIISDSTIEFVIRVPSARQFEKTICGNKALNDAGFVLGSVTAPPGDSIPKDLRVVASWLSTRIDSRGADPVVGERHSRETSVSSDGSFRLCGVSINTLLVLNATAPVLKLALRLRCELSPA
jgi:hypothetical protein